MAFRAEAPELRELLQRVRPPGPPPVKMVEVMNITVSLPIADFEALQHHAKAEGNTVEALLNRLLRAAAQAARENQPDVRKR